MPSLNHLGADEAATLRDTAARLAEIDNLRETSSLREVLLDLSYALANLVGPIGVLTDEWIAERNGVDVPGADDLPDTEALVAIAAAVRHLADNT
jgi:hypothetical protein